MHPQDLDCPPTTAFLYNSLTVPQTHLQTTLPYPTSIEAVSSKRNFESYIKSLGYTPTIKQLSRLLGVNESTIGVYIHRYKTEDLVDMTPMVSEYENEIYEYIREIYDKDIVRSSSFSLN